VQQHVIERFLPVLGGRDRDLKVLADPILPDVLIEHAWTKPGLVLGILLDARRGDNA
jgi:hypothetical protein